MVSAIVNEGYAHSALCCNLYPHLEGNIYSGSFFSNSTTNVFLPGGENLYGGTLHCLTQLLIESNNLIKSSQV